TQGSETVVAKGLTPGEQVVVDGQPRLVPGAKVEVRAAEGRGGRPPGGEGAPARGAGAGGPGPQGGERAPAAGAGGAPPDGAVRPSGGGPGREGAAKTEGRGGERPPKAQ